MKKQYKYENINIWKKIKKWLSITSLEIRINISFNLYRNIVLSTHRSDEISFFRCIVLSSSFFHLQWSVTSYKYGPKSTLVTVFSSSYVINKQYTWGITDIENNKNNYSKIIFIVWQNLSVLTTDICVLLLMVQIWFDMIWLP